MAGTGKAARFMFDGVSYTSSDCLQSWDLNSAINDIVYQCNGYDKHAVGTKTITFSVSLALAATETTKVIALTPGNSSTQFSAHPAGDHTSYIEISSTEAQINSANISAPVNGIIAIDAEIALSNITYTTAST